MFNIVDLRTVEVWARCDDGYVRRLVLDEARRASLIGLLGALGVEEAAQAAANIASPEKRVSIYPGVRLDDAARALSLFLAEIARGETGRHEGPRNGILLVANDEAEGERSIYIYQTVSTIVIRQA